MMNLVRQLSSPRQQLDARQRVYISITSLPSASADGTARSEAVSPQVASTTRTSTPSSSSSATSDPSSSSYHKRHHSLMNDEAQAPASSNGSHSASSSASTSHNGNSGGKPDKAAAGAAGSEGGKSGPRGRRGKGGPRGTKGLRYFSILVCAKLSERKTSSYNAIADLLISESRSSQAAASARAEDEDEEPFDEKNIRRRIYDALNVLMAIDLIVKDKKIIRWNGPPHWQIPQPPSTAAADAASSTASSLPSAAAAPTAGSSAAAAPSPHDRLVQLRQQQAAATTRVREKRALLTDQVLEYVGMRHLLERNADADSVLLSSSSAVQEEVRLYFPFILVNTRRQTTIDCEMSERHDAVSMGYSDVFSVHDQTVVVRMIGKAQRNLWEKIPLELQGLVLGLDDARSRSDQERRAQQQQQLLLQPGGDDSGEQQDEEEAIESELAGDTQDDEEAAEENEGHRHKRRRRAQDQHEEQPGEQHQEDEAEEEEDDEEEDSELERPLQSMAAEDHLQVLTSPYFVASTASSYQQQQALLYPLQPSPLHPSLFGASSSSSSYLYSAGSAKLGLTFPSPLTHKQLSASVLSPSCALLTSPSPYHSQLMSSHLPSPLRPLLSTLSSPAGPLGLSTSPPLSAATPPAYGVVVNGAVAALTRSLSGVGRVAVPSSSSRLFSAADVAGVRRAGSGSSSALSSTSLLKHDEHDGYLTTAQITVP